MGKSNRGSFEKKSPTEVGSSPLQIRTHHDEYSNPWRIIVDVVVDVVVVVVVVVIVIVIVIVIVFVFIVIVEVKCCCIFMINYCWQTPRASFAFGLSQMLTFHIILRPVETKRVAARVVFLLLALVSA